ncbi:SusC/RagA family TonB-linked outer membrane protein [Pedobacter sp. HMF7647]|uniref:SusC/RagA family TonB-linked outer membrane protein n=1 Tax=Hufsiella arboris TaxID=2695275 RepID=A0A7K1Y8S4_9SPHI|nr:TonB-dependent receptor [Hufsiella arboris]MXV51003.1 SusC/RagA family TonB-linked outer membrane protein [Hufsiella arboris]
MKLKEYAPLGRFAISISVVRILIIAITISGGFVHANSLTSSAKKLAGESKSSDKKAPVTGRVTSEKGEPLVGVSIKVKGSNQGVSTDADGKFTLNVPGNAVLQVVYIGYVTQEIRVNNRANIEIQLKEEAKGLEEVVVTGYGRQKKGSITGAVSSVTSKDIDRVHAGSTVSSTLAGKIPGVTFRMPDGRPGASANIQIRNMGTPLYVIDGIQQDQGQFNNLSPADIESITVLKDASAAIYGVRAANGVVVVTTKQGANNSGSKVNIDAYAGFQDWYRFPEVTSNSYDYMRYRADAEINSYGSTNITQAELDKYKQGESAGPLYRSFNWRDYVLNNGAPQNQVNVNFTGGTDKINYYVSGTNLFQNSVLGREYKFNRSNIQSNIGAKIAKGLKLNAQINGRIETRQNPGVPGGDDYFLSRLAVLRNTPLERPYANDNPEYLNDLGPHLESNYAFLNEKISGKLRGDWRVLQTNFSADYDIPGVKGLAVRGVYSYYLADYVLNNHEYTYKAYTYQPTDDTYKVTGGATNPWREREQRKEFNNTWQAQINYNNTFGKHTVGGTLVAERIKLRHLRNWIHASPVSNNLPLIYFPTADTYQDRDDQEARTGYIGRINYNFANRYYVELSGRRDASYLFAPDQRVGWFPGVSAGWRITEEPWMKNLLGENSVLNDLKIRGSYGVLGDDRDPTSDPNNPGPIVPPYAYLPGYTYGDNFNQNISVLDGNGVTVSRDKGVPVTQISWLKSKITDIGVDYVLLNNKLSGSLDYFYRKRTGLKGVRNDILLPVELGYGLPAENLNSDSQQGGEVSLAYNTAFGKVNFQVGGNFSYSRQKNLTSYNPVYFNSWDQYRTSTENRYSHIDWGYVVDGQFQSMDEINNYPVNIDGRGNTTLLPGDLKYKDQNGDGVINDYDERPIGYGYGTQPNINFGFNLALSWNNFDFHADFSGGSGYTWFQNWETRWAFQNNGNLNSIFEDRWHRADMYDPNSAWVPGKYPANRYNPGFGHSDYELDGQRNSTFWLHNVRYLRARTLELGYSLPKKWISKVGAQRARLYANAYNLFSFDNLKEYNVDPEVADDNGLQFPQNKVINFGINLTF